MDSIPWVHHSKEEGSLDYDGGFVRLQVDLNFNTNIYRQHNPKPKQNTEFKKKFNKKKNEGCFVCRSTEHWASVCPSKFVMEMKSVNMVINEAGGGTSGYGNPLPYVLSVCNSPNGGWIVVLISMCVLIYLCLHPFRSAGLEPC
jgi:hypothetical protein